MPDTFVCQATLWCSVVPGVAVLISVLVWTSGGLSGVIFFLLFAADILGAFIAALLGAGHAVRLLRRRIRFGALARCVVFATIESFFAAYALNLMLFPLFMLAAGLAGGFVWH
jgi:hypothetical protein